MDSFSSQPPPIPTPGWNDPPVLNRSNNNNNTTKTSLLLNRHRRPVDPSIQLSALQPTHENSSFPRTSSYSGITSMNNQHMNPPQSNMHTAHSSPDIVNQHKPVFPVPNPMGHQTFEAGAQPNIYPNSVYDVFTIPSNTGNNYANHSVNNSTTAVLGHNNSGMYIGANNHNGHINEYFKQTQENYIGATANTEPPAYNVQPLIRSNVDSDPTALIFSPPNAINNEQQRPATQPDPQRYVAPTKAPGDVSLNGVQLVGFLTKASLRLPMGATRDGIQLRIGQLNGLVHSSQISENCIKRLNFVVDAIDRGIYDEAWTFYENMQTQCPGEMVGWSQGIKLLISELKRSHTIRASSAGTRFM